MLIVVFALQTIAHLVQKELPILKNYFVHHLFTQAK